MGKLPCMSEGQLYVEEWTAKHHILPFFVMMYYLGKIFVDVSTQKFLISFSNLF